MNEEIKKLCQKIYDEHKNAIDMIIENIKEAKTSISPSFNTFINTHAEIVSLIRGTNIEEFLPRNFLEILPKNPNGFEKPYPLMFWFAKNDVEKKIKFGIQLGPFNNPAERLEFIKYLEENRIKINKKGQRINAKWTRLNSPKSAKFNDPEDQTEIINVLERLYNSSEKEIEALFSVIKDSKLINRVYL